MHTKKLICFATFVLMPALVGSTRGDPVPEPWISQDIGIPIPGSADWDPYTGLLTISGNGNDIWNEADNFHYVYREWTGDCDLICLVVSFPNGPDGWQKAGLMVRQNNSPGSPFVDMVMTGIYGGGANFQWRDYHHGLCGSDIDADNVTEPYWVRLTRTGNTFAGYLSPDGFNWTQLGSNHDTIMFDPVLIGFCVTSHSVGNLVTATFEYDDACILIGCPPPPPRPGPPDGAVDVPVDVNLVWTRGDFAIQEEVYFGTDPYALPLVATIMNLPQFPPLYDPPGDLVASTTYYWQIVEVNGLDRHEGNIWEFTTIRGEAQCDYPADGAIITGDTVQYLGDYYIWTKLMFIPGATAVSHTGYFHEDYSKVDSRTQDANLGHPPYGAIPGWEYTFFAGNPQVAPANYTLKRNTKYYWTADAEDALGNVFAGDIWEFAVQGFHAFEPSPPNEAMFVSSDVLLSWLPGFDVVEHDIYMGTNWEDVNNAVYNADNPPPEFVATRPDPYYQVVSGLPDDTKIYWRVDQVNGRMPPPIGGGTYYKGDVWCFTTLPCFCITEPNLVAWWKFDMGVGPTAWDWSSHDNHGTLMGDPQWVTGGKIDGAMDFDGSGDYIWTGKSASDLGIGGNHARTVAAWVFTRAFNNGAIWDLGAHSDSQDFCLRTLDTDNQWRIQYGGSADHDFTYPSLNRWVHFAVSFEPPSSSTLFADGVVISMVNDATLNTSNANPFQIGCHGWQNNYFNGIIDDVRIYDYAIYPPDIPPWPQPGAWKPSPYNGQVNVSVSVTLKWMPGKYAAQHDVYLSTDKAAVTNATTSSTGIYQGRIGPNSLPVLLDAAELYYWRVDEVNLAGPAPCLWKGGTWMFRTVGAAGGLLGLYYHWDPATLPPVPAFPPYPGPPNPFQILVTSRIDPQVNFNWGVGSPDPSVNVDYFACKWIGYVECPVDANYTFYTTTDEGARLFIDGVPILPADAWHQQEMTELNGSVMLTTGMHDIEMHMYEYEGSAGAKLRWSAIPTNPLDDTISKQIIPPIWLWPPLFSSGPRPPDGATINDRTPTLEWISGINAAYHELYFSANYDDVNNRNPAVKQILTDPCRPYPAVPPLELGRTYYWLVDEVKSASERWDARSVWSFTISDCLSVDNMEDYNDSNELKQVWRDGYADVVWGGSYPFLYLVQGGSSGSNLNVSTAVGSPVQGATGPIPPTPLNFEAMVLRYDNDGTTYTGLPYDELWRYDAPYFSEIEANTVGQNSLDIGQTWNSDGVKLLSLSFQGHPISDGDYDAPNWPIYTVSGRGRDIGGRHDEFYFLSQYPFVGNGSIQAQVLRMDNTDPWAKAGVMIRENLTPYSKYAAVFMTPGNGVVFQFRYGEDGPTTNITKPGVSLPQYVRLIRNIDGSFEAKHSDNPFVWQDVNAPGTAPVFPPISMGTIDDPNLYLGSAVTSHNANQICSADFTDLLISPLPPNWIFGDIGTNAPEQLYVALEDTVGNIGVVEHDDPNAVTLTDWQEWNIPLTDFTGVDMNSVKKVYIGLGDREAPVQGGSGAIYVDDIRACPPRCIAGYSKPLGDIAQPYDCIVDEKDLEVLAGNWLMFDELIMTSAPSDVNLAARYPFEGDYLDYGVHTNHLLDPCSSYPGFDTGVVGSFALSLDGVDDYLVADSNVGISGTVPRTIACWAKADHTSIPDGTLIFGFTTVGGGDGSHFNIGSLGGPGGVGANVRGWEETIFTDEQALDWHHYAMSYDGTTIRYYGDGIEMDTEPGKSNDRVLTHADRVHVGKGATQDTYFPGKVDEARIYSAVLSKEEIAYLGTNGAPTLHIPIPSDADLYKGEAPGSQWINFRDYALIADKYLEQVLWPTP
jgi:hypothetical protein